ncbi:hypothetical protein HELRODRAFT_180969 [Helobdella robusta]|uniref:Uncharacterized protein n=1 Tax=Helobdella robusta TaxID=6412 RepID=T1FGG9_HELRO|nr:hypothetical protein HELRODRAFT_180969 [Helobdella robusta]ESN93431.1 hypothetical protein HELRODRAFT_180969 [Helobdella robusta]
MGCTSSKPKRTKSLEDVKGQAAQNGQITKEDTSAKKPTTDKNSTDPIQIPGANKSFQAPDGIPFIDEDVDEDDAKLRTGVRENSKKLTDDVNIRTESSAFIVNGNSGVRVSASSSDRNAAGDVGEVVVNEKGVHVVGHDGSIMPIKKGPAPSPITDEQTQKRKDVAYFIIVHLVC